MAYLSWTQVCWEKGTILSIRTEPETRAIGASKAKLLPGLACRRAVAGGGGKRQNVTGSHFAGAGAVGPRSHVPEEAGGEFFDKRMNHTMIQVWRSSSKIALATVKEPILPKFAREGCAE